MTIVAEPLQEVDEHPRHDVGEGHQGLHAGVGPQLRAGVVRDHRQHREHAASGVGDRHGRDHGEVGVAGLLLGREPRGLVRRLEPLGDDVRAGRPRRCRDAVKMMISRAPNMIMK